MNAPTADRRAWERPTTSPCWSLDQTLHVGPLFTLHLARPAHCGAPWPADYVLKRVRADAQQPLVARQLLAREVQLSGLVMHPHLTTILASDLDAEPAYLVRPYHAGRSLRQLLEQTRSLRICRALWTARQVAEGLAALHQQQWLHGDIKADNVIVADNGHVTLIDLGFAVRYSEDEPAIEAPLQTSVAYAAPEVLTQTFARSPASDIYSLGVLLYEMLTGRLPFLGSTAQQVAQQHVQQPPGDPRTLAAHLPTHIARLVLRLLSKAPAHRPSAAELIDKLYYYEIETFAA